MNVDKVSARLALPEAKGSLNEVRKAGENGRNGDGGREVGRSNESLPEKGVCDG